VHLAAFLQTKAPTLLIDGDPNRSASGWAKRGSLPFRVIDERQAARFARDFEHVIIDTQARPEEEDLKALAGGCDMLILPTTPDALSLDALMLTVGALEALGASKFRVLLTVLPPKPSRDGDEARQMLQDAGLPVMQASVRRLAAFQKAALKGCIVQQVDDPRASLGWLDYQTAGLELLA